MRIQFVLLLQLALHVGCSAFGTGTGNPFAPDQASTSMSVTAGIVEEACNTVTRCHVSSVLNDCRNSAWTLTTFTEPLGLESTPVETVMDIDRLENEGGIQPNTTGTLKCHLAIRSLDCSETEVQRAYQPALMSPYGEIAGVLTNQCRDVFAEE